MEEIRITQGNDFTLTVTAYAKEDGGTTPQDLREVEGLAVSIPKAPEGSFSYAVDSAGRLIIDFDGPMLAIRSYGIEAKGIVNGKDWCWRKRKLFEIVKYTDDSNDQWAAEMAVVAAPAGLTVLPVIVTDNMEGSLLPNTLYIVTK